MEAVVNTFNKLTDVRGKRDDDFFDRLSSRYTVLILFVFAGLVSFYQIGGSPIACWFPAHFTKNHAKFGNSYCWVKNTYYLPYEHEIPAADEEDNRQMIVYYQWIPFILLAQALFFKLPSIFWHGLNSRGGVDSDNILAAAGQLCKTDKEERREKVLKLITNQMDRFLGTRRDYAVAGSTRLRKCLEACCNMCGRRFGAYLAALYILSKLLYIANAIFQLLILNWLLQTHYISYGLEVMRGWASDHDWHNSPYVAFPRVTMCDFNVRRLGNLHRYTVQCALPLNLFNEKIYVFLWFWLVFILACSLLGFLQWVIRLVSRRDRLVFVKNHLYSSNLLKTEKDQALAALFLDNYLRHDGAFVLRLVSHNTNNITTTDIITSLWGNWLTTRKQPEPDTLPIRPTTERQPESLDEPDKVPLKGSLGWDGQSDV